MPFYRTSYSPRAAYDNRRGYHLNRPAACCNLYHRILYSRDRVSTHPCLHSLSRRISPMFGADRGNRTPITRMATVYGTFTLGPLGPGGGTRTPACIAPNDAVWPLTYTRSSICFSVPPSCLHTVLTTDSIALLSSTVVSFSLVGRVGFEPTSSGVRDQRHIQLDHRPSVYGTELRSHGSLICLRRNWPWRIFEVPRSHTGFHYRKLVSVVVF